MTVHHEDWNRPKPATLPRPNYSPAAFALGNTLLLWGLLTTWIISIVGGLLCIGSAWSWGKEIVREHDHEKGQP